MAFSLGRLFEPSIKKEDIAVFLENTSFLLQCGYTAYEAVYWVCDSSGVKKRDGEAKRVQAIGRALLKHLNEGYSLSASMLKVPQYFGAYSKQVEAAEESGQVAQVLDQIVSNIRESGDLKHKIKSAMMYPAIVLSVTLGIAWYLFTFVIPDVLNMLADVGTNSEIPMTTQIVMSITDWMRIFAVPMLCCIIAAILILVICAKGPFKLFFHRLYTRIPFVSKISLASNVCSWMQSMRYMLSAGSPIANAMSTAADSMTNIALRREANKAYRTFESTGMAVAESLKHCSFLTAMELSTINVGLESGQIEEVLARLSERRKKETEKAISAFITALNPMVICILGVIVGTIVMAVYGPLINISSSISG